MVISVTGCSTWMRVFISRKKNSLVVGVDHELDRAGAAIALLGGERDRGRAHGAPGLFGQLGRRRLLDDLLIAALDRAVALEQVHGAAVAEAEHLDLDVARLGDEALEVDGAVAERALGHLLGRLDHAAQLLGLVDPLHADAAAAAAALTRSG